MANTSKRGFASMDPSKQREIASKGGRAAHAKGTAHEFTSDEARVAGRKGGEAVSRDRAHMSAIGREGGHSRGTRARETRTEPISDVSGGQGFPRATSDDRGNPVERTSSAAPSSDRGTPRNDRGSSDSSSNNGRFQSREEL